MSAIKRAPQTRHASLLRAGSDAEISASDIELIRLLQADGRISFVDLSEKLGMAEKTARKRVAELRALELIEITTVASPRAIGYNSVALVGIRITGGATRLGIAERLFALKAVDYAVTTFGSYDVLAELVCCDNRELGEILDGSIRGMDGVKEIEVFPYLSLHYQQPAWDRTQIKDDAQHTLASAPLDKIDRDIIHHLSEDGRVAFLEISRHIGISESQIRKRYARLVEQGVVQVLAMTNPRSIGYHTIAWVCLNVASGVSITAVGDLVSALPSVAYIAICAGKFDVLAEVMCRDADDLFDLVDHRIRSLPGVSAVQTIICEDFLYRRIKPAGG
ncbi:Lrp/AsnC family transcriptional regulator [Sinorhizobium alkalisoli]|uniref:Lrp/AsnC family transcriptional regulator n=1 Tax=Sinorhizobium alkalisoli TaxID=1752398 RepID=UPI00124D512F|nr:Lrp/AsnC family transcriptional regulator [Sinorhizobium alkalisoli]QFI68773.1 Transcriptional regulator, AsnC family [Sinorhizobium alkalisoli]